MIERINNKIRLGAERLRIFLETDPKLLFLFYLLLAMILRWQTFWKGELDHDISTYLVMANEWLKGHVPFVYYIDVKPPGIYALFALAIKLGGHVLYGVRIMGAVFIALGAWGFHRSASIIFTNFWQGLVSGILFIGAISLHKWSWAVNTEIFFVSITGLALYYSLKKPDWKNALLWGGILGIGFTIKYHILFDALAIGLLYLLYNQRRESMGKLILNAGLAFFAFILPFGLITLWYVANGYTDEFLYVVRDIPSRYQNAVSLADRIQFVSEFYVAFLPLSLLILFALFMGKGVKGAHPVIGWFVLIWTISCWGAILLTGKPFFHYYVQAIPPLIFGVIYAVSGLSAGGVPKWSPLLVSIFVLLVLLSQFIQLPKYSQKGLREMEGRIAEQLDEDDRVYIQQKNILYFLLDRSPIERFVHNSLMFSDDHIHAFGIDLETEAQGIQELHPEVMLLLKDTPAAFAHLSDGYTPLDTFANHWVLWSDETRHSSIQP